MGKNIKLYHFDAKILPDRNYIQDMLFDYEKYWTVCSKNEYEEWLNKIKSCL